MYPVPGSVPGGGPSTADRCRAARAGLRGSRAGGPGRDIDGTQKRVKKDSDIKQSKEKNLQVNVGLVRNHGGIDYSLRGLLKFSGPAQHNDRETITSDKKHN